MTKQSTAAQASPAGTDEPKAADFPATEEGAAQFKSAHDAWQTAKEAAEKAEAEAKAKADAERQAAEQKQREAEEELARQTSAFEAETARQAPTVPGLITGDYLGNPITR